VKTPKAGRGHWQGHGVLSERWVVVGTAKDGSPYNDDVTATARPQPNARAEYLAAKENARGGKVRVVREVWNGPAARWDVVCD
jgi:hypothetical protein